NKTFILYSPTINKNYTLSLHDALPIYQKELTKMQLDNQKEIAEMQNETQKEIAGIQSATSRQNTKDRSEEQECRERVRFSRNAEIGRAVQQECRDRSRMPSSA